MKQEAAMEHRTEYDLKAIGRNLKRLRESRHLTVEQVREYLCLGSVQAVYKYESGTGYPQADTLLALMELYGAGVDDIVRGHEEEQGSSFNMRRNREINRIFKVFLRFRGGKVEITRKKRYNDKESISTAHRWQQNCNYFYNVIMLKLAILTLTRVRVT